MTDPIEQRYVLLPDRVVAKCPSFRYWHHTFNAKDREVLFTIVNGIGVSTIFTGVPHRSSRPNHALVFETRVFGGPHDGKTDHHESYVDAVAGHHAMLARAAAPHIVGEQAS